MLTAAIQVEPYIQKGNEGFVHHYVIYECDGNFTENDFNEGVDCHTRANMPYRRCQQADLIAAWAVGGEVSLLRNKLIKNAGVIPEKAS